MLLTVDNGVLEVGTNLNFLFQQDSTNLLSEPSGNTLPDSSVDTERWEFAFRNDVDWSTAYNYNSSTQLSNNNPWRQEFLDDLAPYSQLRFIHWTNTNGSGIETWSQKTDPNSDQTQLSLFGGATSPTPNNGVAWEWVIDLGNRLQKDIWINVPLKADDNYVQELGNLIEERLDPNLNVYVEYHNEIWLTKQIIADSRNTTQFSVDMAEAEAIDIDSNDFDNALNWYAHRSAEIWDTFATEFGSTFGDRVIKVVAGQNAAVNVGEQIRDNLRDSVVNPTSQLEDAYAVGTYFGAAITDPNDFATLQSAADAVVAQAGLNVAAWATVGTNVIGYEGGQELTGQTVSDNVLFSMNSDPRMKTLYLNFLQALKDEGLEAFNHFAHAGVKHDATGNTDEAWGSKQYVGQPDSEAPKYAAIAEFVGFQEPIAFQPLIHDGPVASYDTTGIPNGATVLPATNPGWTDFVTATDVTIGPGLGPNIIANHFAPRFVDSSTLVQSINSDEYISFSVTVDPGHVLDVTSIDATLRSTNQQRSFGLFSSATGFTAVDILTDFGGPIATQNTNYSVDLFDVAGLDGLTGTIEFRIYVYGNPNPFEGTGIGQRSVGGQFELELLGQVRAPANDNVGVHRGNNFIFDTNENLTQDGPDSNKSFAQAGDIPIVGDWNGDGADDLGVYRGQRFILDLNGNDLWDGPTIDGSFVFGAPGDIPISGDWDGDGTDNIGVRRGNRFLLDLNGNGAYNGATVDLNRAFGQAGDTPVIGDWNGDGIDDFGVRRGTRFILDLNGNHAFDAGIDANRAFGQASDTPLAGDWDGDGTDNIGVRRAARFILDLNGNLAFDGPTIDSNFVYGLASDIPIAGKRVAVSGTTAPSVTPEPTIGDSDRDGDVDFADFLILSTNFGSIDAVWSDGDFDADGRVSFVDFLLLSSQFGT